MPTHKTLKHPFGFNDDGNRVVPAEVADGNTAACPRDGCDEPLHVRGPSTNGTVRHFYHPGSGNGGGVSHTGGGIGESATHKNYKSHAASALLSFFGEFIEENTTEEIFEQRVPVADENRYRQADTLVTFDTPSPTYGKGIIIEVQHENHGKDKEAVEREYLDAGYSVYWTNSEDHYSPKKHLFDRAQLDAEIVTVWPNAVPDTGSWSSRRYEFGLLHPRQGYASSSTLRNIAGFVYGVEFTRPYYSTNVQLPREWYEERAYKAFRETPWDDLFTEYEWDARTSLPMPDNGTKRNRHTEAPLPKDWHDDREREAFRETPWDDLFTEYEWDARTTLPTATDDTRRNQHTAAYVPLVRWLAGDGRNLVNYSIRGSYRSVWTQPPISSFDDMADVAYWELENTHTQRLANLEFRGIPAGNVEQAEDILRMRGSETVEYNEPSKKLHDAQRAERNVIHCATAENPTCDPGAHHIVSDGHIRYCDRCGTSTQTLIKHPEIDAASLLEGVV